MNHTSTAPVRPFMFRLIAVTLLIIAASVSLALFAGASAPAASELAFVTMNRHHGYSLYLADSARQLNVEVREESDRLSTPVWSPDGAQVAYRIYNNDGHQLQIIDATSGETVLTLADGSTYSGLPAWSPDGEKFAFVSNAQGGHSLLYVLDFAAESVEMLSPYTVNPITPVWSQDGAQVHYSAWRSNSDVLITVNQDGTDERILVPDYYRMQSAAWSPDRQRIAFANTNNSTFIASSGIFVMDVEEGAQAVDSKTVIRDDNGFTSPVWSPDSSHIAFISNQNGTDNLYVIALAEDADSTDPRQLTHFTENLHNPLWSPDGSRIVFFSGPVGDDDLYSVRVMDGAVTRLTFAENPIGIAWRP